VLLLESAVFFVLHTGMALSMLAAVALRSFCRSAAR
jgi:hypothetical protein